jgi:hypothetical protein
MDKAIEQVKQQINAAETKTQAGPNDHDPEWNKSIGQIIPNHPDHKSFIGSDHRQKIPEDKIVSMGLVRHILGFWWQIIYGLAIFR